jgi:DNA-binding IclR family transcriptional regulator
MTTVARIVRTLVSESLLQRSADHYSVGLRVNTWAAAANAGSELIAAATPIVERLRDETSETAGLYIRGAKNSRVKIANAESTQSIAYRGFVGQVLPLHAGAGGKVLMAFDDDARTAAILDGLKRFMPGTVTSVELLDFELDLVRQRGWAFSAEEREFGLNSLASPVFDASGEIVAALSIGGPSFRLTADAANDFAELVVAAARVISSTLLWSGPTEEPILTASRPSGSNSTFHGGPGG